MTRPVGDAYPLRLRWHLAKLARRREQLAWVREHGHWGLVVLFGVLVVLVLR